jgi:hypothetical protein
VHTGHIVIGSLIASLDREDSRLPDIQRGNVWKHPTSFLLLTNVQYLIDGQQRLISLQSIHDHRENPLWTGTREEFPVPASE